MDDYFLHKGAKPECVSFSGYLAREDHLASPTYLKMAVSR